MKIDLVMKILRFTSFVAAAALSMMLMASCQEGNGMDDDAQKEIISQMDALNLNSSMSDNIEFMFLTPDGLSEIGTKNFILSTDLDANYPELEGKSYIWMTTSGRMYDELITLSAYFQNISEAVPGDKLNLCRTFFGALLSSNSGNFTDQIQGDIFVKSITDKTVTLRFAKVQASIDLGKYYINGDLTFDIE